MPNKTIALVAHDHRKPDLLDWAERYQARLRPFQLVCTGTTGRLLQERLGDDFQIRCLKSGPLGGDQQLGALIAEQTIDLLIFLWDPMQPQPHDVDVKALLRLAVVYNIPTACNLSTADFLVHSTCFAADYQIQAQDYTRYTQRDPAL